MNREMIIVLDFGGQYNQLIARRVRECNVYCEVHPYSMDLEKIREMAPKGIIFTGGPNSVYLEESPHIAKEIFEMGIPILGICYGSQLMAHTLGGQVATAPVSEYGKTEVDTDPTSVLFKNLLDEPHRLYSKGSGRFPDYGPHPCMSGSGYGMCGAPSVCGSVPPRGCSHGGRYENAFQFRI